MKTISKSLKDTREFAQKIVEMVRAVTGEGAYILDLEGGLGAGKTTLVQMIGEKLGVKGDMQSPTFVLMKSYKTKSLVFKTLVHIDAYRIENPDEIKILNLENIFRDKESLVCIEWGENLGQYMPKGAKKIICTLLPDDVHSYELVEAI